MFAPAMGTSDADVAAQAFRAALDSMPGPLFAVLDGGHFDDLEDELAEAGISSRSLFLKGGDDEMRRDGPWLVALKDNGTRSHIEGLALEKPCAVFWSCPEGEQALWRHLRSINEILVPDDRIAGNDGRLGQPIQYERVLFRHWDPNVLGALLPLLTSEQFARVFGPATAIFMNATDYGGFKRAPRPENLPPAPAGFLRIELQQISDLEQAKLESSRRDTMRYLREAAEDETRDMDDRELYRQVVSIEKRGLDLGFVSMTAHLLFAFMCLTGSGDVVDSEDFRQTVADGNIHPDDAVEGVFDQMIAAAEQDSEENQ